MANFVKTKFGLFLICTLGPGCVFAAVATDAVLKVLF